MNMGKIRLSNNMSITTPCNIPSKSQYNDRQDVGCAGEGAQPENVFIDFVFLLFSVFFCS